MSSTTLDIAGSGTAGRGTPRSQAHTQAADTASSGHRDAHLDNAKFVLIALVFVGHAIAPNRDTHLAEAVYFWIYLFHMPAFALICGYMSKSFDASARRIDRLIATVLLPYLIFWTIYVAQGYVADRPIPTSPLEPMWLTWFLAALFVWRLSVPFWHRIRWPVAVAVVISVGAAPVVTGDALDVSRILSMLPFFVLGLYLQPRHLALLHRRRVQVGAVLTFAGTALACLYLGDTLSIEWTLWRETLVDREAGLLPLGMIARVGFLALATAMTLAFLALIPRRHTWFTHLGAYTMFVYLLHGLPIRIAEQLGWYEVVDGYVGLAVNCAVAMALTLVLCMPWMRRATGWLVEPKVQWAHRRPSN